MPSWDKHLFGKRRTPEDATPASLVAVRLKRLTLIHAFRIGPLVVIAVLLGTSAFGLISYFLFAWIVIPTSSRGAPPVFSMALEGLRKSWSPLSIVKFVTVLVGTWAFFRYLMPRIWDHSSTQRTRGSFVGERRWRRHYRKYVVLLVALLVIVATSGFVASWPGGLMGVALMLAGLGSAAAVIGATRRVGLSRHCISCQYPMGSWRKASTVCPECGNPWKEPWRACVGRHAVDWRWISAGVAMFAASLGLSACVAALISR